MIMIPSWYNYNATKTCNLSSGVYLRQCISLRRKAGVILSPQWNHQKTSMIFAFAFVEVHHHHNLSKVDVYNRVARPIVSNVLEVFIILAFHFTPIFDSIPLNSRDITLELFESSQRQSNFQGYNGTIFAYGQTGTGKTFTMEGDRSMQEMLDL